MQTRPSNAFDPVRYRHTTRQQWDSAAEAWHRWEPQLRVDRRPQTPVAWS